ncbi:hypothetical protein [Gordonia sp. 852002-51296_SCH5728562-b]|uniref:hypothetical protein n=1 Tax=Gordonia sp. 852002-51296_SCH5728562-b TaxID=1834101 RepID=UPI0007EAFB24|nr:hypothetical protein [Gordonia sp. 852002-51296_SCH5728562-b]OBA30876.1 hypothetical protein A5766_15160 [Gordonia sp. 852002-51296_SCH5728562-b]
MQLNERMGWLNYFIYFAFYIALAWLLVAAVRKGLVRELVAVVALFCAVIIPNQIDVRDREQQAIKSCVDTVLGFRESLSGMYVLPVDQFDVIQDKVAATASVPEHPSEARIAAQNAKDSTYILCRNFSFFHPDDPPWSVSPASTSVNWTSTNVADLYAWTSQALDDAQGMKARPVSIPFLNVPVLFWQ